MSETSTEIEDDLDNLKDLIRVCAKAITCADNKYVISVLELVVCDMIKRIKRDVGEL